MLPVEDLMAEIRDLVERHARSDARTPLDGVLVSRHETSEPDYQVSDPLFVLMAAGAKRLYFDQRVIEYRAGECLVVTTGLPLSGQFVDATPEHPALAVGVQLRPSTIAALVPQLPPGRRLRPGSDRALGVGTADAELLDALVRMLRLLDRPADAPVLAPMIEREILWRLLNGPLGSSITQLGLADSGLAHVSRAIARIRERFADPVTVPELAQLAGMSVSTFHRHFRAVTGMTPLQFQKHLRLQEARSLLLTRTRDVTGIAHLVGYSSPTQFNREYRRLFGAPPGRDAAIIRSRA